MHFVLIKAGNFSIARNWSKTDPLFYYLNYHTEILQGFIYSHCSTSSGTYYILAAPSTNYATQTLLDAMDAPLTKKENRSIIVLTDYAR